MVPKAALLAAIVTLALPQPVQAHDIYSRLLDALGGSCCSNQDCRPAPYRLRLDGVEMYVDGHWIAVPNEKIQFRFLPGDTGESGGGHWCGTDYGPDLGGLATRCAFLPPNSASSPPISMLVKSR